MIEELLNKIGLSNKASQVYLAIFELGKSQIGGIVKQVKQPRSTVFGFLDELHKKGLIKKDSFSRKTFYSAVDPKAFKELINFERNKLAEKEQASDQLINLISPLFKNSNYHIPDIQFREGKAAIEKLLYQYEPKWRETYGQSNDYTMWGYQDHTFVEQYKKWHEVSWKSRSDKEVIKLFSNAPGVKQQKKEKIIKREIRALPKGTEFASSIWIHGDYILLAMTRNEPHYAVLIKDQFLSSNLRVVFQLLWKLTEK